MKSICSWCGKDLGMISSDHYPEDKISHGICEACAQHIFAELGMPLRDYLDGLPEPVAVVSSDGTVQTANNAARNMLGKDQSEVDGFRGGEVFECRYARLSGGCGNTMHCSGCTIRLTVMDTFETGKSQFKVPAYLNQESARRSHKVRFLISTEKVGGFVLLRIDDVEKEEACPSPLP